VSHVDMLVEVYRLNGLYPLNPPFMNVDLQEGITRRVRRLCFWHTTFRPDCARCVKRSAAALAHTRLMLGLMDLDVRACILAGDAVTFASALQRRDRFAAVVGR
jgi:hypothetical protein